MLALICTTSNLPNKQCKDPLSIPSIPVRIIEAKMWHPARDVKILRILHRLSIFRSKTPRLRKRFNLAFHDKHLIGITENSILMFFVMQHPSFLSAGWVSETFELSIDVPESTNWVLNFPI